ncbi:hypothetical protein [Achromobacter ruhlandii]|uniref:hypothetical protein n=1 Tax=Achromobacter ruhlandii TaxID=72557 RepID=UPI003D20DFA7
MKLAMGVALGPRVVRRDEPAAGLSKDERARSGQVLSALAHTHGLCCLLVEHDLDFVAEVATRIIVLHQGRIVRDGSFRVVAESELVRTIYDVNAPAADKTAQATRQASQQATEQAARQDAQPATPPVSPEGAQP